MHEQSKPLFLQIFNACPGKLPAINFDPAASNNRYALAYSENQNGDQMVCIIDRRTQGAILYHGGFDWTTPSRVLIELWEDTPKGGVIPRLQVVDGQYGHVLTMHKRERFWLTAIVMTHLQEEPALSREERAKRWPDSTEIVWPYTENMIPPLPEMTTEELEAAVNRIPLRGAKASDDKNFEGDDAVLGPEDEPDDAT